MIDLTDFIGSAMIVLIGIVTVKLIPYIKSKVNNEEFKEIQMWVKIAVEAAEMIFKESGMGKKKKEYVVEFLKTMGFSIDFEKIDKMIESAVLELQGGK